MLSVVTLLLAMVLAACSTTPPTGSLQVTVSGLPNGVDGAVTVSGPGGYSHVVTATGTLSDLALGTYSVTAGLASNGNAIVPTVYDGAASSSSVTVAENTTASTTVNYTVRPGSGHLWVPQSASSSELIGYARSQLGTTGSPTPDVAISGTGSYSEGAALDNAGNLWISDLNGHIYYFTAAQLASSGTPTPSTTMDATAYGGVVGLAFDSSGNLWAADYGSSQLLAYTPAQLASGGAPTPTVVLSATSGSISSPVGIAFDASGDLWVVNLGATNIVEFTPSQLAATGSPTPAVTIGADSTPSLTFPYAIAFDAGGNMWVSNLDPTNTVVRYDASQLATSGNPTPAATISSSSLGVNLVGLAFDHSGALWVAGNSSKDLRRFTNPAALTGNVSPTPDVVISGLGSADGEFMAFSPQPANLPINTP